MHRLLALALLAALLPAAAASLDPILGPRGKLLLDEKFDGDALPKGWTTAKDFHVKKPGLVFRVGGKAGQEVLVDNVKVWELK